MKEYLKESIKEIEGIDDVVVVEEDIFQGEVYIETSDEIENIEDEAVDNKNMEISTSKRNLSIVVGEELNRPDDDVENLQQLLLRNKEVYSDNSITYILDKEEYTQTYAQLFVEAKKILAGLKRKGIKAGDKVIFLFDRNDNFIETFWACILGGIIPAPITVPKSFDYNESEARNLITIWHILDEAKVLTSETVKEDLRELEQQCDFSIEKALCFEDFKNYGSCEEFIESKPDDLAILLFTSGSTGVPKGVMQTHGSILAREFSATQHNNTTDKDIGMNWMPLEHVGSLVMWHIRDMYAGCSQVQVMTSYVLTNPIRWVELMSRFKVSTTWAPNFAYELVTQNLKQEKKKYDWDLSAVNHMLNGGEAVSKDSCVEFIQALKKYNLKDTVIFPSWGMSETCAGCVYQSNYTLEEMNGIKVLDKNAVNKGMAVEVSKDDVNSVVFTNLGSVIPNVSMRIVDTADKVVEEYVIGELQVKGPNITKGYYNNDEANQSSFTEDGWFRTGDLAFIANGEVTITGRAKELIIRNGIHYVNSEIEGFLHPIDGIVDTDVAAYGVFSPDKEGDIIVIFFVPTSDEFEIIMDVIDEIRDVLLDKINLVPNYVIPIKPEDFQRTNIGKVQRALLGKKFQEGKYNEIIKKIDDYKDGKNKKKNLYYINKPVWIREDIDETIGIEKKYLAFVNDDLPKDIDCIQIRKGNSYKKLTDNLYEINPIMLDDYVRILKEIETYNIAGIIHMWNAQNTINLNNIDVDMAREIQKTGVYSMVLLIKAMMLIKDYPLVFATSAECLNDAVDGMIASVLSESENLRICSLKSNDEKSLLDKSIMEITNGIQEKKVAYKDDKRYVSRLADVNIHKKAKQNIIQDGSVYLLTGGLGGVGFEVARYLMVAHQNKIVIAGSSDINKLDETDERRIRYEELLDYGDVEYLQADIGNFQALKKVVDDYERQNEAIEGVIHLAAASLLSYWDDLKSHEIENESLEEFERVFTPKVYGTLNLYRLFKERDSFSMVMFSSVNGYFGGTSFGAYSAASSFMNSMVEYIKSNTSFQCKCISWSAWNQIGMNSNNPYPEISENKGFRCLSPEVAIQLFQIAVDIEECNITVGLDIENDNVKSVLLPPNCGEKQYKILCETKRKREDVKEDIISIQKNDDKFAEFKLTKIMFTEKLPVDNDSNIDMEVVKDILNGTSKCRFEPPVTELQEEIAHIWKNILKREQIGLNDKFFECGGNSLNSVRIIAMINEKYHIKMDLTNLYKSNRLKDFVSIVEQQITM
ncbi:MAG: SDR family NAD(P)-dependent oxidoreductase [Pseudobutyrivibrio sp.]|nr:SDR family NAD(P)-dependent oxidoreductase [Pseudobutyrivibrio sp.]